MFELPVEDIFILTGVGVVFSGTIASGEVAQHDRMRVMSPTGHADFRVATIHELGKIVDRAGVGTLVGIIATGKVDFDAIADGVRRGDDGAFELISLRLVPAPPKERGWWPFGS
jgi:GTPase